MGNGSEVTDAAAFFLSIAGIAVNMWYGPGESVASYYDAFIAMQDYFFYKNDMDDISDSQYSDEEWKEILKEDRGLLISLSPKEKKKLKKILQSASPTEYFGQELVMQVLLLLHCLHFLEVLIANQIYRLEQHCNLCQYQYPRFVLHS